MHIYAVQIHHFCNDYYSCWSHNPNCGIVFINEFELIRELICTTSEAKCNICIKEKTCTTGAQTKPVQQVQDEIN